MEVFIILLLGLNSDVDHSTRLDHYNFLLSLKVRMTSGILVMIFKLVKELLKMESI